MFSCSKIADVFRYNNQKAPGKANFLAKIIDKIKKKYKKNREYVVLLLHF